MASGEEVGKNKAVSETLAAEHRPTTEGWGYTCSCGPRWYTWEDWRSHFIETLAAQAEPTEDAIRNATAAAVLDAILEVHGHGDTWKRPVAKVVNLLRGAQPPTSNSWTDCSHGSDWRNQAGKCAHPNHIPRQRRGGEAGRAYFDDESEEAAE